MQRINLFPDPLFKGKVPGAPNGCTVVYSNNVVTFTGKTNTVQQSLILATVTGLIAGAQYVFSGNVYVSADSNKISNGNISVFSWYINRFLATYTVEKTGASVPFTCRFTAPADGKVTIALHTLPYMSCAARSLSVELASTYDTGVGGASGLLLGGHDAKGVSFVGRVMSDDDHEPMHEPILDHHPESRQVGEYHDPSEREWGDISDQRRGERHRRHYLDNRSGWRHQRKTTCQLQDDHQQFPSDINELSRQVRQSDRHSDEHAHLHVGRIPGEQDPARQHRIFRRGYDATRLTSWGVMA